MLACYYEIFARFCLFSDERRRWRKKKSAKVNEKKESETYL